MKLWTMLRRQSSGVRAVSDVKGCECSFLKMMELSKTTKGDFRVTSFETDPRIMQKILYKFQLVSVFFAFFFRHAAHSLFTSWFLQQVSPFSCNVLRGFALAAALFVWWQCFTQRGSIRPYLACKSGVPNGGGTMDGWDGSGWLAASLEPNSCRKVPAW